MATSGAMSTSNQYIKYTISITQNSQNIANNTSNVTVSVRFYRTNTGYTSYGTGTVYCKINGTTYSASVTPSQKITNSGIVLFTKTLNITHADDGTKKLTCSAWISHDVVTSSEQSYTQTLTTIPRKSTLSVGNGTLGTAQTLTVTRQSTSFTHTITATCGSASTTICTKSTSTSISFTPPISWASQNTTGTSVSVKYTITTYSGNTSVGSNSYTKTCSIPSSVKPSVSLSVSDSMGYADKYGKYIKGQSKFYVKVTPTLAYGSPIASYSTTANGSTYTSQTFTTGVLKSSGTLAIEATVKDKRGRSGSLGDVVMAYDYSSPSVSSLSVKRCAADGTIDSSGEYLKVTFSAKITSLDSQNTAAYSIQYKKTSATSYTSVALTSYAGQYSVSGGVYIFPAETASSYNVTITATDDFKIAEKSAVGSSVSKVFSLLKKAGEIVGMAIGKVAETENLLDIEFPVRFRNGIVTNVLWSGSYYMTANHTIPLSEPVSKQPSGIVLVFCRYEDEVKNEQFSSFFVSKHLVSTHPGCGHDFKLGGVWKAAAKYLYIHDGQIVGHDKNNQTITVGGITYTNDDFVLRYVIGV